MKNFVIPPHTFGALYRWYRYGYQPGGFLSAVIKDEAWFSAAQADPINRPNLADIILFNRQASQFSADSKGDWESFNMKWEAWRIRYSPDATEIDIDREDNDD